MARGVNKVTIIGNLGQDPEIRYMPNGKAVANVSVATSESWKDKNTGESVTKTEWHRVIFFDKLAEIIGEYLQKGSKIYVEGKLQTRKWQDKGGADHYTTEIMGKEMQMLDGVKKGESKSDNDYPPMVDDFKKSQSASPPAGEYDDDIPF